MSSPPPFHRTLHAPLKALVQKKLVLLSGPRQVGKTELAKALFEDHRYYNYDIKEDFPVFLRNEWDRSAPFVIFDELHKMRKWKLWLKGIVDSGRKSHLIVTGSARMDTARKMGDSLAGRHFLVRLNPLDLKELRGTDTPDRIYERLLLTGGFPEPYFEGGKSFYGLWKKTHLDLILRQDLISLENVRDIEGIEILIELLSERVGSTVSMNSLARELNRHDKTIAHWVRILESLFVVFRVAPYSKNIASSLKKASKFYFYDLARVRGDEAMKLENLVALSLKKEIEHLEDTEGLSHRLHFLMNRQHQEIDFLVLDDRSRARLIEVKLGDDRVLKNFYVFSRYFKSCEQIQLVRNLSRPYQTESGIRVEPALRYLTELDLRSAAPLASKALEGK
jgi:predicted AAA+ superfamily ATPase